MAHSRVVCDKLKLVFDTKLANISVTIDVLICIHLYIYIYILISMYTYLHILVDKCVYIRRMAHSRVFWMNLTLIFDTKSKCYPNYRS